MVFPNPHVNRIIIVGVTMVGLSRPEACHVKDYMRLLSCDLMLCNGERRDEWKSSEDEDPAGHAVLIVSASHGRRPWPEEEQWGRRSLLRINGRGSW